MLPNSSPELANSSPTIIVEANITRWSLLDNGICHRRCKYGATENVHLRNSENGYCTGNYGSNLPIFFTHNLCYCIQLWSQFHLRSLFLTGEFTKKLLKRNFRGKTAVKKMLHQWFCGQSIVQYHSLCGKILIKFDW